MNETITACADRLINSNIPLAEQGARLRVCIEALSWLGTPYHPHGRIKGAGVDCATILAEVFAAAGLVAPLELGDYAPDWHLHRNEEKYLAGIEAHAHRSNCALADALPGDIALFKYGRTISHGAIVLTSPLVIHSCLEYGVVMELADNGQLAGRYAGLWTVWESQDGT